MWLDRGEKLPVAHVASRVVVRAWTVSGCGIVSIECGSGSVSIAIISIVVRCAVVQFHAVVYPNSRHNYNIRTTQLAAIVFLLVITADITALVQTSYVVNQITHFLLLLLHMLVMLNAQQSSKEPTRCSVDYFFPKSGDFYDNWCASSRRLHMYLVPNVVVHVSFLKSGVFRLSFSWLSISNPNNLPSKSVQRNEVMTILPSP